MTDGKAILRQAVEKIGGVSRTWFEWILEDSILAKRLVVEIESDTDPENPRFKQDILDSIEDTLMEVSKNETTSVVGHLRIIPKAPA